MDRDGLMSEVASVEIQILPDAKTERIHALESVTARDRPRGA